MSKTLQKKAFLGVLGVLGGATAGCLLGCHLHLHVGEKHTHEARQGGTEARGDEANEPRSDDGIVVTLPEELRP